MTPPIFTVAPSPTPTQSLLQWSIPHAPYELGSVEMDTEIAEHLAALAARNRALTVSLEGMVWAAQMAGGWSEHREAPLGIALDALKRDRELG